MLIRISLIVALVAGLAAAGLAFFKVADQAKAVISARDEFKKNWDQELALRKKTQGELKKTSAELETTKSTLETTKTDLAATTSKANKLEKTNGELETKLASTTTARDEAQQKLSAYELIGLAPEQIKATRELLTATQQERDAIAGENKILTRELKEVQTKLAGILGPNEEVKLPDGLKGKILAVDPRFNFVVLSVGTDQGALERGKMLVARAGKLIGKVQIVSVEKDRCVANILPAFKGGDVMEGDEVLY